MEEHGFSPCGVGHGKLLARFGIPADLDTLVIPKLLQQFGQFVGTAMHIADNVEGAVLVALIRPEARARDARRRDLLRRLQGKDIAKAFTRQATQRAAQILDLAADDVRAEIAVGPLAIALLAEPFGQVEDNRYRQNVIGAGKLNQGLARLGLNVGCIDDGQAAGGKAFLRDIMQHIEGIVGG